MSVIDKLLAILLLAIAVPFTVTSAAITVAIIASLVGYLREKIKTEKNNIESM